MTLGFSLTTTTTTHSQESDSFPTTGLLPKTEIGALEFLDQHPSADGRGVIVAVLDDGVDPGAPGMQTTTTGEPKLIAVVDATGSGDVRTDTVVKAGKKGTLEGLTGRELTIGKTWKNPSGDYHLGKVSAYYLFPEELVPRVAEERQEKWDAKQRELERQLQANVEAYENKNPSPKGEQKDVLEDLKKQLAAAKMFRETYEDPGPIYDCVVFNDGKTWRAVIDTDEDGDLAEEKVLANFDEAYEYGAFGDDSLMNFGVNIYDEGNLLSVVVDTGMHGTHVAGIVGAHFEDQPELNGVAPGVQIVAIKIGDTRIAGMETPHALSRAAIAIRKYGCDLVNMSYGEAIRFPKEGNLIEKLSSLVDDDNVVYVSSAGNSGPALTTVEAPGGTTSAIIGVGATVTPELMKTSYSLLKDLPTTQFTKSSRGPTIDGDLGVDISAPGGAIAPVPRWELSKNMRANGTSMASPDACGGLALVLSALKAENKNYTAMWVKRAAMHAAKQIPGVDVFAQGQGMIQIGETYEILKSIPDSLLVTPRFEINVGGNYDRGIYLRNGDLNTEKQTFSVSVKPRFPEDTDKEVQADFEARYVVTAKDSWVSAPEFVFVNSLSKRFNVAVDLKKLEPGVHYSEVIATDASYPEAGPVFRIPVTVVVPTDLEGASEWETSETLAPGVVARHFFQVPQGATWVEIEVEAPKQEEPALLVVHPQHVIPGERYVNVGDSYYLRVSQDRPGSVRVPVIAGATMELALGQYWNELETVDFDVELKFHGLNVELGDGVFAQGEKGEEFRVVSQLETSRLSPSASLSKLLRTVAPSSAEISVSDKDVRDEIGKDGEAYHQLVLDYPFELAEDGEITPEFPMLNDKIYEIEFESQLQMIYDANKQYIATEDAFPNPVALKKGKYSLRLQLRHKERSALESMKSFNLTIAYGLDTPVGLKTYTVTDHALLGDGSNGGVTMGAHTRTPLVVAGPGKKAVPEFAKAGDRLAGTLKLQKDAPVSIPLQWVYNGNAFVETSGGEDAGSDKEEPTLEETVADALLKLAADYRKDENKEAFDALMKDHLANSPRKVEVALEKLRWFVDADEKGESSSQIKKSAQAVLSLISEDKVARYFGVNHEADDATSKALAKRMKNEKAALVESYSAIALADSKSGAKLETLESDLKNLKQWTDTDSIEPDVQAAIYKKQDRKGELLALLNKAIDKNLKDKESQEKRLELLKTLGWDHLVEYEKSWMNRRFAEDYLPF